MIRLKSPSPIVYVILLVLTILLILLAGRSLQWRYQGDAAVMLYLGYTIDHFGLVPYREVFDFNAPGAYLFNIILGRLTGYSDLGFRIADILYLAAIGGVTWLLLRAFSRRVAWLASVGFSLAYLFTGPAFSFEREYIMILPIALATLVSVQIKGRYRLKAFIIGLLFSITATLKPNAALGLPIVLFYIIYDEYAKHEQPHRALPPILLRAVELAFMGVAIPIAIAAYYLAVNNALPALIDTLTHLIPVYSKVGYYALIIEKPLEYYLRHLTGFGTDPTIGPWVLVAALGAGFALTRKGLGQLKPQIVLFVAMTVAYLIYPVFQGQFWSYHYMIALYFATILTALILATPRETDSSSARIVPDAFSSFLQVAVVAVIPMVVLPFWTLYFQIAAPQAPPNNGIPDTIAAYLKGHLQPGETVLTSDWVGGGLHAMLLSGAKPADKYLYDFFLYISVSTPYIQQLRQDYVQEMRAASPRYVIQIIGTARPAIQGTDTADTFPAFQTLLDNYYTVVESGTGFKLYERGPAVLPPDS